MAGSGRLERRSPGGTSLVRTLAAGLLAAASLTAASASALPPGAPSTTDWAQFRFSAQHSGLNPYEQTLDPSNVAQLTAQWSFTTGGSVDSSPAVVGGVVYVGSFDHNVYAIDAATGAERWSFPTGDIVDSSPAVANGVVYVGSFDGRIYAIDALTGSMLWDFITRGRVRSSPAVDNGV